MPKMSSGLLVYRYIDNVLQVFLVHPGGPFWSKKEQGAWSIPKGEHVPDEDSLKAAKREFVEETGFKASGHCMPLHPVRLAGGKIIRAWAMEGNYDPRAIQSNTFTIEWPPHSGLQKEFPEIDRAAWFSLEEAKAKIHKGQTRFLDELERIVQEKISR